MRLLRQPIKYLLNHLLDAWAQIRGFSFPASFIWPWKFEYLSGRYELETTRLVRSFARPGMIVMDVGANLGYFTRLFADLIGKEGKVYAFEPDKENWVYLSRNIGRIQNAEIFQSAVSAHTGVINFYHVIGATGLHSIVPVQNSEKRQVSSIALDDFVRKHNIDHVDILKIDVEGAEPDVFSGMKEILEKFKPLVIFEYTPDTSKSFLEKLATKHHLWSISPEGKLRPLSELKLKMGKHEFANVVLWDSETN